MQNYLKWRKEHKQKIDTIVNKLSHLTKSELVDYFEYENMKINEPDFCPLYKDNKKCHNMEYLNCYFCACPFFEVTPTHSLCNINSKYGSTIKSPNGYIHQNCSNCTIPHTKHFTITNI